MTVSTQKDNFKCYPLGDAAIVIQFADEINLHISQKIKAIGDFLDEYTFEGFVEYVPAFSSITIYYQPWVVSYLELTEMIDEMMVEIPQDQNEIESRLVEIPVIYGDQWGPDLEHVAEHCGLTTEEVIKIHSAAEYRVYMIGFAPGFPYLGGMDERIATPRKENPRPKIEAGSVGIAGLQTGVYPIETPGGWQIIGRTAIDLFDSNREEPALLKAGDRVRFTPISSYQYLNIRSQNDDFSIELDGY